MATPDASSSDGAILLVEDHADSLYLLATLLRRTGYTVHEATCCADALAKIEQATPRLLVSDLALPDCTGHELLRQMRQHHPTLRALALSAHTGEAHQLAAREAGFDLFMPKPFRFDELLAAIQALMN
jgi:DNA-binding response OmpR family regulator